jgi:hypothetical protein
MMASLMIRKQLFIVWSLRQFVSNNDNILPDDNCISVVHLPFNPLEHSSIWSLDPVCPAWHNATANFFIRIPSRHIAVLPSLSKTPLLSIPSLCDTIGRPEHCPLVTR